MQRNATKAKLKAGETVFGCFVRYPHPGLIELLAYAQWDFLVFDGEHGTLDASTCENMVRAAELRGVTPLVRIASNAPSTILCFLDTGAQGVHVPWINCAAEAEAAVRSVKYFPRGHRGLAGVRAADYGQVEPLTEYVRKANAETLVVAQIETAEAVENLPGILAVKDIDVVFVGPTDLAHAFGFPGQPQHAFVTDAIDRIAEAVARSQAELGIWVGNTQSAREWRARGARYIATSIEPLIMGACHEYLRIAHE